MKENNSQLRILSPSEEALDGYRPFKCVESLKYVNNTFIICTKDSFKDQFISAYFLNFQRYDEYMMTDFLRLLHSSPDAYVLDIGCNIGPYSLLSASAGHAVIAVDPMPENHALLYNSLVLSQVTGLDPDLVIQIVNSISDDRSSYIPSQPDPLNPGHTEMLKSGASIKAEWRGGPESPEQPPIIKSILLQDLLDLVPAEQPVIIKIDVEGYECKAMQKFLSSPKKSHFVEAIMMETWSICSNNRSCPNFKSEFLPSLRDSGYKPFTPFPATYQEIISNPICNAYILFVHESVLPVPFLENLGAERLLYNDYGQMEQEIL